MNNDLQTNISGAVGLGLMLIEHFWGLSIPGVITNYVIVPIAAAAIGHFIYKTNKPDKVKAPPPSRLAELMKPTEYAPVGLDPNKPAG